MITTHKPTRLFERLAEVHARCPELRSGQFLATVAMLAEDETGHSIWEVSDNEFAAALERFATDLSQRGSDPG